MVCKASNVSGECGVCHTLSETTFSPENMLAHISVGQSEKSTAGSASGLQRQLQCDSVAVTERLLLITLFPDSPRSMHEYLPLAIPSRQNVYICSEASICIHFRQLADGQFCSLLFWEQTESIMHHHSRCGNHIRNLLQNLYRQLPSGAQLAGTLHWDWQAYQEH